MIEFTWEQVEKLMPKGCRIIDQHNDVYQDGDMVLTSNGWDESLKWPVCACKWACRKLEPTGRFFRDDIKCGNIEMGAHLLDRIADIVRMRLEGASFKLSRLEVLDHTWIVLELEDSVGHSEEIRGRTSKYIKGIVTGLLIQAGVDVI
jgi:hypothetical protein